MVPLENHFGVMKHGNSFEPMYHSEFKGMQNQAISNQAFLQMGMQNYNGFYPSQQPHLNGSITTFNSQQTIGPYMGMHPNFVQSNPGYMGNKESQ